MGTISGWVVGWANPAALAGTAVKPDEFGPGMHSALLELLVDTQAVLVDPSMDSNPRGNELDKILKTHNSVILQSR